MNTEPDETEDGEPEYLPLPMICCTRPWHKDREHIDWSTVLLVIAVALAVIEVILAAVA